MCAISWLTLLALCMWSCAVSERISGEEYDHIDEHETITLTGNFRKLELAVKLQPNNVTVREGQTASLRCHVDRRRAPADLEHSWYLHGNRIEDSEFVSGASNDTLFLHNITYNDIGPYHCHLTSRVVLNGTTRSHTAWVKIRDTPQRLDISPTSQEWPQWGTITGSTVLTCRASMAHNHTVPKGIRWQVYSSTKKRWLSLGKVLSKWEDYPQLFAVIDFNNGFVSRLYLAFPVPKTIYSIFRCRSGSAISRTADFHLVAKTKSEVFPKVYSDPPVNVTAMLGEPAILRCSVFYNPSGLEPYVVAPSGIPKAQMDTMRRYPVTTSTFRIPNVTQIMSGRYLCFLSENMTDRANVRPFYVNVVAKPKEVSQKLAPDDAWVDREGAKVILSCKFTGWPRPSIYWLKNGTRLPDHVHETRQLPATTAFAATKERSGLAWPRLYQTTLTLNLVTWQDAGIYQCFADNGYGMDSAIRRVFVITPIRWVEQAPSHVTAERGGSVFLPCSLVGLPRRVLISWFRGETLIATSFDVHGKYAGPQPRVPVTQTSRYQLTSTGSLNVTDLRYIDNGYYTCAVQQVGFSPNFTPGKVLIAEPSRLTVTGDNEKPRIVSELPPLVAVKSQRHFSAPCRTSGFPEPNVTWLYLGDQECPPIGNGPNTVLQQGQQQVWLDRLLGSLPAQPEFSVDPYGSITVGNVQPPHHGNYMCLASSNEGVARQCMMVTVSDPPVILRPDQDTVEGLASFVFGRVLREIKAMCQASGAPTPEVKLSWKLLMLNNTVGQRYESPWVHRQFASHITYIPPKSYSMNITCEARNKHGYRSRSVVYNFFLPRAGLPTPPGGYRGPGVATTTPTPTTIRIKTLAGTESPEEQDAVKLADSDSTPVKMALYFGLGAGWLIALLTLLAVSVFVWHRHRHARYLEDASHGPVSASGTVATGVSTSRFRHRQHSESASVTASDRSTETASTVCAEAGECPPNNLAARPSTLAITMSRQGSLKMNNTSGFYAQTLIVDTPPSGTPMTMSSAMPSLTPVTPYRNRRGSELEALNSPHLQDGGGADWGNGGAFFGVGSINMLISAPVHEGGNTLQLAHVRQPSSSWGGVDSPLKAATDEYEYEDMQPAIPDHESSPTAPGKKPVPKKLSFASCPNIATPDSGHVGYVGGAGNRLAKHDSTPDSVIREEDASTDMGSVFAEARNGRTGEEAEDDDATSI